MERLGVAMGGVDNNRPFAELLRCVQAADETGYELVMVPEAWGRDALVSLAYLAAHTERVQLGTGIVNVYSRSAAVVAMAAATLDDVSGGRAVLGLGVSGKAVIEGWHGVPMERPLARLRDYVGAVRKILARDRAAFAGETFRMAPGFALRFRPVRQRIPIYLASITPAALRLTGEVADGWLPYMLPVERLAEEVREVEKGLAKAGRARESLTVAPYILTAVHDDAELARWAIKGHIAFYVGGMGTFYHQTITRHGFGAAADQIRAEWAANRREAAAAAVPDALVDAIAVYGSAARCRARLAEFRQAGADLPIIAPPITAPAEMIEPGIRALGPGLPPT